MKKIFVILLILFVGLLVGCASKSVVVKDFSTSFEAPEEEKLLVKDLNGRYMEVDKTLPWPGYTFSTLDIQYLMDLPTIPEFWNLPENVTCENPTQRPIVGRIVNNTDKEYTFWIVHKITNTYPGVRIYKPDYLLELKVPANSTKYYVYDKPEMVSSLSIGVYTKNKGSFQLGFYSTMSIDGGKNFELARRIFAEIEASHCEEVIFNGEDDLDEYKNYINLVLPFEYNEEDLVSDWIKRY